tara:strand:+ start:249 stop:1376 length:1128 start_codon:yes stop_codon:yes gene_type:complete
MKVITILGTRPEIIRLSLTIKLLDKHTNHIIVHTGQNFDYNLNEVFFKDLGLRKPDYFLDINTSSLGKILGETLIKTEEILIKEKPNAILILGDTNSSIAGIIAKRLQIPIYHIEAGNRSFDLNVPEEINRKIIDHIADFNIVYTERSRQHLISEGFSQRRIYKCGSPLNEIYNEFKTKIESSKILKKHNLIHKEYFLISFHRQENIENEKNLNLILNTLEKIAFFYEKKIIVSTHPRTLQKLGNLKNHNPHKLIFFENPFGFFDYLKLQKNAICVISDSGTISEESSIMNFPAVTLRSSIERPEALDTGCIILTGLNPENVLNAIKVTLENRKTLDSYSIPDDYKITNTSIRILKLILGTSGLSNTWHGIEKIF